MSPQFLQYGGQHDNAVEEGKRNDKEDRNRQVLQSSYVTIKQDAIGCNDRKSQQTKIQKQIPDPIQCTCIRERHSHDEWNGCKLEDGHNC